MARPLIHEAFVPFDEADLEVDIAVVGAGIAGAYSAWRLKQKYPQKRISLFEYSNRVGGRLYSVPLPGMPHVNAELGGMRYIPKSQAFVRELIENLGLPNREFPMGAADDPGGMNNLVYLRRRLMRAKDLTNPAMVPYLMNPTEQGMNPDQLQRYVMNSLVPHAADLTQDQWNETKVFNGEDLYKTGFWNLLYRVLTSEAYQFMDDAGGYYTNVANSTSVLSLPVFEFGPDVKYRTLDAGYEALPKAVVQSFQDLQGDFRPNCRLDSFAKRGESYAMLFVKTSTDRRGCTDGRTIPGPKETLKVSAKQVVLAMPRRSLELVRWEPMIEEKSVREMVNAVISQAAFKIFLGYPYPWWRVLGLQAGRSITDMPLRQTFYFQTEGEQTGADPKNNNSLMMVSYNDLGSVPFWKALEEQTLGPESIFHGRLNPFVKKGGEQPATPLDITRQMVQAAQDLVREIHGLEFIPEPYTAAYHDWSEDPYGAGWHAWKAGVEFWKVMPKIRKPVATEDVYICGEAYSINQGWVEGALQTAELMLEEHFDLKRPSWLPADYNLGY
ncbi:MAG TPA: FAD-dependent oxidoreductase [Thermoanaerobaculia bacterium]|jgi:monoamine oxidase|nr:FAD-dependent oxidoreductase [Thermoanaerobaculia bacterium]